MTNHYQLGPDPAHVRKLVSKASRILPRLAIQAILGDCCVTANTPGKVAPYLDTAMEGLVVACGGCGNGAMCSDEIGRVAVEGRWDSPVQRELCRIRYKKISSL